MVEHAEPTLRSSTLKTVGAPFRELAGMTSSSLYNVCSGYGVMCVYTSRYGLYEGYLSGGVIWVYGRAVTLMHVVI